jgi:hypothetical protein
MATIEAARAENRAIIDNLAPICARVRRLFSESRSNMSLARYEIGEEVRRVMTDTQRYGERAVRRLAVAIDRDEDRLYDYARLADAWSSEGFAAIATRSGRRGVPLSLSHLIVIAKQPASSRDRLVRVALESGMSVRALEREAARLASAEPNDQASAGPPASSPPLVRARRGLRALARRVEELERAVAELPNGAALAMHVAALRRDHAALEEALRSAGHAGGPRRA